MRRALGRWAFVIGLAALHLTAPAPAGGEGAKAAPRDGRLFKPPARPPLPAVKDAAWAANPLDAFVLAALEKAGLQPSGRAEKLRLLRRVTLDLTGLPPTPAEQEAFLRDSSPGAYERVVERLLASPAFGERWAQHWLDLVRYAETDGFKADDHRPDAHRYRDYAVDSFNADLPYDVFVRQQLAGDELEPDNPQALIATGFNRLGPDEYNAANLEQRRQEILDDVTDTTGLVFLGLTAGCARCHDHKYDPLTHKDYFRLQAFFAPMQPRELPAAGPAARKAHARELAAWEAATREVREEMAKLVAAKREELRKNTVLRFRAEIQTACRTPEAKRTPYQVQIAAMAELQLERAAKDAPKKLPPEQKKRYEALEKKLKELSATKPRDLPVALAVTDVGPEAPPTHRLVGGDWRKPATKVEPGFPAFLSKAKPDTALPAGARSTGRRAALARWLTAADNPLTARVMVNRLWQHHFGRGLVATPSDFGVQGSPPSHPELLDWLAVELVESGWSLKHLHRLMVTSSAYCQDSAVKPKDPAHARALAKDADNQLLWHARRRRLEGEALRDGALLLAGELSRRMGGPSARPELPEGVSKYAWKADERPEDRHRRSVYVLAKRNLKYPLFDAFDQPDLHNSCACRQQTTTAPQALLLLNGDFTLARAKAWSEALQVAHGEDSRALAAAAYRAAWGRPATPGEVALALEFLTAQTERHRQRAGVVKATPAARAAAAADFCHALLNTNEFLYVD